MRVHELDEAYGASKDQVKRALELADLSTHHLSRLDESELKSFEFALDSIIDEDVEDIEGMLEDFDSALKGEPSPLPDFSDEEKEWEPPFPGELEITPESDLFPMCDDRGAFTGNCSFEPDLAAKVRAILLPGHRINDYTLNLDRGHLEFVVWETARKHRVWI